MVSMVSPGTISSQHEVSVVTSATQQQLLLKLQAIRTIVVQNKACSHSGNDQGERSAQHDASILKL